jgi:hypothetical protein
MSVLLGLDVGTGGARPTARRSSRGGRGGLLTVRLCEEVTEPDPERTRIYEEHYEVYRSLYPATRSAVRRLTELATNGD